MSLIKRYFEDVKRDEELPSFQIAVTRTHIVKYAGAGGDFFPIHHDDEFAKSVGLPSVFAMGLMHGGMLSRMVTDWAGDGRVRRYKLQFIGMVWPGDTLTFTGAVVKKNSDNADNLVDLTLKIVNQRGETIINGDSTVLLPSKSS